ncbi:hypothetical protein FRC08_001924 [Ceratobasidium sp. 394]|nr:hypothetical protein FRC08_001924 [Ceratobasidium sp. 394]
MSHEGRLASASPQLQTTSPLDSGHTPTMITGRTDELNQLAILDQSVVRWERVVQLTPDGHPEKPASLFKMGSSLCTRYQRTGRLLDLDRAIDCYDQALAHKPEPRPNTKHIILASIADALQDRFEAVAESPDADRAVLCQEEAIRHTPDSNAMKPARLSFLSYLLGQRFLRLGSSEDFDAAIARLADAVILATPSHGDVPRWLSNLSSMHLTRYEHRGMADDLDKAVNYLEKSMSLAPNDDSMPIWLGDLGNLLSLRFELGGALSDINRAIDTLDQATRAMSEEHPSRPELLNMLGTAHARRFGRLGELTDIDKAVDCHGGLSSTPDDDPRKPSFLNNLGNSLQSRFESRGNIMDLGEAIVCHGRAKTLTPKGDPNLIGRMNNLSLSLRLRFETLGSFVDLQRAIEVQEEAMSLIPGDHTDRSRLLHNLGALLIFRFTHLGELADINEAVSCLDQSLSLTSEEDLNRIFILDSLGLALRDRFLRQGKLADIDRAVSLQNEVVSLATSDHAHGAARLNNLAGSLQARFRRLNNITDIDMAIRHLDQAILLTPQKHPDLPRYLNNLASSLGNRFEALGSLADINKAVESLDLVIKLTPNGHALETTWSNNLGVTLLRRFELTGAPEDINRAIECQTQSVALVPDTNAMKSLWLMSLGISLESRYSAFRDTSDGDQAITYLDQALLLISEDDSRRAGWANTLGSALHTRFKHLGNHLDLERSIKVFGEAARSTQGDPWSRFDAACNWARLSSRNHESTCLEAYALVMSLVPSIVWMGNMLKNRYRDVTLVGGVVIEAVAVAIEHNAYDLAVEWLEEGRSIVWKQKLRMLTPMDDLRRAKPELADELGYIAFHIGLTDTVNMVPHNASPHELSSQRYRRLAEGWDKLLQEARLVDGFHNFLLPKKLPQLLQAAHSGVVAIVNMHEKHCDVLLLRPNFPEVAHLPLPSFSYKLAIQLRDQLFRLLHHGNLRSRSVRRPVFHVEEDNRMGFRDILATLWSGVVQPVLTHLGYLKPLPIGQQPRLTWCTTGPLSFLPLHAAGCYDTPEPENRAFNYVLTSYTPTLDSLIRHTVFADDFSGILAIGLSSTIGQPPLPGTVQEIDNIAKHAGSIRFKRLVEGDATIGSILEAMGKYSWIHFACHASQDVAEPTSSAFYLHDRPLDLTGITWRTRSNADFAFLSACQTALGDENLPDEWVHLAGAMNMTGYSSLIATMWSIHDQHAPLVADQVYAALFKGGVADSSRACRALHEAMHHLRTHIGESDFSAWVPFIHVGL